MRYLTTLVMRAWLATRQFNAQSVPRPTDAPRVYVAGMSSARVLIFGSGAAIGWGVVSHELALTGALARALASRSGRGADVEVVADMRITARNALSILHRVDAGAYDVVVVVLGANDAAAQTSLTRWVHGLSGILAHLAAGTSSKAQLFVTGIPPIHSVPGFGHRFGIIATEHAARINQKSKELCAPLDRVTFVPLPQAERLPAGRFGDGHTYRLWATAIAEVVAPTLHSARWGAEPSRQKA